YKSSSMGTLNHAEMLHAFSVLREDIVKTAYAAYVAELADKMTDEQDASSYVFKQMKAALEGIEEDKDAQVIVYIMELMMLKMAGYAPVWDRCISCGSLEQLMFASPSSGGALCTVCAGQDHYRIPLGERARKLLYLLQHVDLSRLGHINV